MKMQPVFAPVAVHGVAAPDSALIIQSPKTQEGKGPESNPYQPTAKEKKELKMVVGPRARRAPRSSGVAEPSSALSSVSRDPKGLDLMQFFWNNFMAAPPVVNPDFVPRPAAAVPIVPGVIRLDEKANGTELFGIVPSAHTPAVVSKTNSSDKVNATDIKPVAGLISVDFEVFVFSNPGKKNSTEERGLNGMYLPGARKPFPQLPTNRSAYSSLEAFPAQYVAVNAAAAPTSPPPQDGTSASNSMADKGFTKISLLLLLLVVACSISCVLGSTLPFVMQKKRIQNVRSPSVWVSKSGKKILRPWGAPVNASSVPPVRLVTDSWQKA
ncbi:hypothetical protein V5799_017602 [Amblyomma americanum]|uniref:Uncharacterized protein n=1 Tax=Amblyomma americanum TaxID=6943 RepID=A0AAQ4F1Q9_AMBAM